MKTSLLVLAIAGLSITSSLQAAQDSSVSVTAPMGEYRTIIIRGLAAHDLFKYLKVEAEQCSDGQEIKRARNLVCTANSKTAPTCYIAIDYKGEAENLFDVLEACKVIR